MVPQFFIKALHANQVAIAYPLIRLLNPTIKFENWLSEAEILCDGTLPGKGGIIVIDASEYIHGIYCFDAVRSPDGDDILNIDKFIAVDTILCTGAAKRLIQSIDPLAQILECPQIRIELPGAWTSQAHRRKSLSNLLQSSGYQRCELGFTKTLDSSHASVSRDALKHSK